MLVCPAHSLHQCLLGTATTLLQHFPQFANILSAMSCPVMTAGQVTPRPCPEALGNDVKQEVSQTVDNMCLPSGTRHWQRPTLLIKRAHAAAGR